MKEATVGLTKRDYTLVHAAGTGKVGEVMTCRQACCLQLFGKDHLGYGELKLVGTPEIVAGISIGSDSKTPARRTHGNHQIPNEDALIVRREESRVMIAVADAHLGIEASHILVERLARLDIPATAKELDGLVVELLKPELYSRSATTFTLVVTDLERGHCFGFSLGDSRVAFVDALRARWMSRDNADHVKLHRDIKLHPGNRFDFTRQNGLLVVCSDGIHECHYRSEPTSIRRKHLLELARDVGFNAHSYAEALMKLALKGVDGYPGGQDNIALAVCKL